MCTQGTTAVPINEGESSIKWGAGIAIDLNFDPDTDNKLPLGDLGLDVRRHQGHHRDHPGHGFPRRALRHRRGRVVAAGPAVGGQALAGRGVEERDHALAVVGRSQPRRAVCRARDQPQDATRRAPPGPGPAAFVLVVWIVLTAAGWDFPAFGVVAPGLATGPGLAGWPTAGRGSSTRHSYF